MKLLLIFLILTTSVKAQNIFIAKPVITEAVDTIVYHSHGDTIIVRKFKDGSAWVQDKTGVAYYSKKYYRRWKRKNVRL